MDFSFLSLRSLLRASAHCLHDFSNKTRTRLDLPRHFFFLFLTVALYFVVNVFAPSLLFCPHNFPVLIILLQAVDHLQLYSLQAVAVLWSTSQLLPFLVALTLCPWNSHWIKLVLVIFLAEPTDIATTGKTPEVPDPSKTRFA